VQRSWRKPLVVITPKSLLRHPKVISSLDDLATGHFQRILPDTSPVSPKEIRRVVLCTGKIYYELEEYRETEKRTDTALIRLEQLYPLRLEHLEAALSAYGADVPVYWVQEEPANMGAWSYLRVRFGEHIAGHPFAGISRAASASPAAGSHRRHKQEQSEIISRAFNEA
jgi:2-oxoglutarate dehydrogenase E1 component